MMRNIAPKEIVGNPFAMIGDQWMLITAGNGENCNTMTASWGGLGVLWNAPVATCYVRPQRYTKEFLDREEYFTLTFFGEEYRKALSLCGTKSGRDMDKVKECGFTVKTAACGAPYFEEAETVFVCRKLYSDFIKPEKFCDDTLDGKIYGLKDYHKFYVGEIVKVLVKE